MIDQIVLPIIIAVIGSGGFFTFIQFMIGRHDREYEKKIDKKLDGLSKNVEFIAHGCTRTQLMVLMKLFNDRKEEIITVAHRYFVDMKGDFYMTTLFESWLEENKITRPEWFKHSNV